MGLLAIVRTLRRHVGASGVFFNVPVSKYDLGAAALDAGLPLPNRLAPADAEKATCAISRQSWAVHVSVVGGYVDISQVAEPVVVADSVDVIDVLGPFAVSEQPCQTMTVVQPTVYPKSDVPSRWVNAVGRTASGHSCGPDAARKNAGFAFIVKNLVEALLGKSRIAIAHAASLIDVVLGSDAHGLNLRGRCAIVRGS